LDRRTPSGQVGTHDEVDPVTFANGNEAGVSMQIEGAFNELVTKLTGWFEAVVLLLPNLVVAMIAAVAFGVASRVARRAVYAAMSRVTTHRSINKLMGTIAGLLVLGAGIFIALGIIGLDKTVTSLLAGVGIVGLALGFAFQDIASNFMSGIILMTRQPFTHDDLVETNDITGQVREVNLRSTVIRTLDGKIVTLPNSAVLNNVLINHSASGRRRVDVAVGVAYGDDLEKVRRVAVEAVEGLERHDRDEPVTLFYEGFGSSSIDFVVRFWIDFQGQADYADAYSEAIIAIKKAFDANGITIPFPIRTLDFGVVGGERLDEVLPRALRASAG
jgi:small conductance mechanosensitive channel